MVVLSLAASTPLDIAAVTFCVLVIKSVVHAQDHTRQDNKLHFEYNTLFVLLGNFSATLLSRQFEACWD